MTRRQVLSETLKLTGLLCGGVVLLAGCGGEDSGGTNLAKPSEEHQKELDAANAASTAAGKEAKKK